jgi:hypothetical protein
MEPGLEAACVTPATGAPATLLLVLIGTTEPSALTTYTTSLFGVLIGLVDADGLDQLEAGRLDDRDATGPGEGDRRGGDADIEELAVRRDRHGDGLAGQVD